MTSALIGYTGFVGSNILAQKKFSSLYNSKNINSISGKSFDLVVCAGAPGVKWLANKEPRKDLASIKNLISNLKKIKTKKFVLISTVDVYPSPINVYEDTPINSKKNHSYGQHRYLLEQFVRRQFPKSIIIRLPGLFGINLKKNFIYDLIHHNALDLTHFDSKFQFYNLANIYHDIQTAAKHSLTLVNFATDPISVKEIAKKCFQIDFTNVTQNKPVSYDMKTKYAKHFGSSNDYLYTKSTLLKEITQFAHQSKQSV